MSNLTERSVEKALRSRVEDLQTHCWPTDANAVRELWAPEAPLVTSFACPVLCKTPIRELIRLHGRRKFDDITGVRYGQMIVVGLIEWRDDGRSQWALCCECGRYEPRNHQNIIRGIRSARPATCHICAIKLRAWDGETNLGGNEPTAAGIMKLAKKLEKAAKDEHESR